MVAGEYRFPISGTVTKSFPLWSARMRPSTSSKWNVDRPVAASRLAYRPETTWQVSCIEKGKHRIHSRCFPFHSRRDGLSVSKRETGLLQRNSHSMFDQMQRFLVHDRYVRHGIAVHHDEVCQFSHFDAALAILLVDNFRAVDGGLLQKLHIA
jgi:hypothetical protein